MNIVASPEIEPNKFDKKRAECELGNLKEEERKKHDKNKIVLLRLSNCIHL